MERERERERERETNDTCYNCELNRWWQQNCYNYKAKKSITAGTAKENSQLQYFF